MANITLGQAIFAAITAPIWVPVAALSVAIDKLSDDKSVEASSDEVEGFHHWDGGTWVSAAEIKRGGPGMGGGY